MAILLAVAVQAKADTTNSFIKVPVAVICPTPKLTAYLESADAPPQFSKEWEYAAGHAHCRTVKNDRPLLITKSGRITFHDREYAVVELFPAGVIVSTDGFGGPYYLLTSRIRKLPTAEQMHANRAAFLPTQMQYGNKSVDGKP